MQKTKKIDLKRQRNGALKHLMEIRRMFKMKKGTLNGFLYSDVPLDGD